MKIQINYLKKEFGCGEDASTYKITLSKSGKNLQVDIDFDPYVAAINDSKKSDARIKSATITIPERQALDFAISILGYFQKNTDTQNRSTTSIQCDETDIETKSEPCIKIYELADSLKILPDDVLNYLSINDQRLHNIGSYIPLWQAISIMKQVNNKEKPA